MFAERDGDDDAHEDKGEEDEDDGGPEKAFSECASCFLYGVAVVRAWLLFEELYGLFLGDA